jgi:hypothetical protein
MFIHASRLHLAGVAALLAWSIGARSDAAAQGRFELLGQEPVAAVNGLTVYTIRDGVTASCYTLFVLDTAQVPPPSRAETEVTEVLTPEQLERVRVAQQLRDAIAARNRSIEDLRSRSSSMWLVQYENLRLQIDSDYERTVRSLLPGLYPSATLAPSWPTSTLAYSSGTLAPGWPTSSPEEVAAAVRTAIAEGDSVVNTARQSEVDAQMQRLLKGAASNRLAAVGPLTCPAVSAQTVR